MVAHVDSAVMMVSDQTCLKVASSVAALWSGGSHHVVDVDTQDRCYAAGHLLPTFTSHEHTADARSYLSVLNSSVHVACN